MSLFGKPGDRSEGRSAEDRERARLEREARRRAARGEAPPPELLELQQHEAAEQEAAHEPAPEWAEHEPAPEWAEQGVEQAEPYAAEHPHHEHMQDHGAHHAAPALEDTAFYEPIFDDPEPGAHQDDAAVRKPALEETAFYEPIFEDPEPEPPQAEQAPPAPEVEPPPTERYDVLAEDDAAQPAADDPFARPARPRPEGQAGPVHPSVTGEHDAVRPPAGHGPVHPSLSGQRRRADRERPMGVKRVSLGQRLSHLGQGGGRVPPPPGAPRRVSVGDGRRRVRRLAALAVLIAAVALIWFLVSLFQPFHGAGHGRVAVRIPRGASAGDIGTILAREGVVSSSRFFSLRAKLSGKRGDLKSGSFALKKDMSYSAAIDALTSIPAPPPTVKVTIPEGRSAAETAPLAKQAGLKGSYLSASRASRGFSLRDYGAPKGTHTLEGFLFPATYELKPGSSAQQLVAQQLRAFKANLAKVDLKAARRKNLTRYDVLIIASMIEREAQIDKDRPLIAAVIYNRLKQGMTLGIDATLRYRLNDWTKPLTVSQLAQPSAYNTRTHQGLPPTPIGNPGLKSLQAAAHPAHVPYLFYVVKPCGNGGHAFSSTDAKFQADVARYNSARSAKGGKSPSKC